MCNTTTSPTQSGHADFGRDFDDELGIVDTTSDIDVATDAMRDAIAQLGLVDPDAFDAHLEAEQPRRAFTPGYLRDDAVVVHRVGIHADASGVDRIRFHGAVRSAWISTTPNGRGSVYAEVDRSVERDTLLGIAVIPTGKRVPMGASRMGSAGSAHFYLLGTTTAECGAHGRLKALTAGDEAAPTQDDNASTATEADTDGEG